VKEKKNKSDLKPWKNNSKHGKPRSIMMSGMNGWKVLLHSKINN